MRIYLVLKNVSTKIGTKEVNTSEYNEYLREKYFAEKEEEEDFGFNLGNKRIAPFEGEKTKTVPVYISIPRIVRISKKDPRKDLEGELFNIKNWSKNASWIEEIEVSKDVEILENIKLTFKEEDINGK